MAHERDYDPRFPDEDWNKALLAPESTVDEVVDDEVSTVEAEPQGEGLRTTNTPTRAPQRKAK